MTGRVFQSFLQAGAAVQTTQGNHQLHPKLTSYILYLSKQPDMLDLHSIEQHKSLRTCRCVRA
jgi:hypothetical protein